MLANDGNDNGITVGSPLNYSDLRLDTRNNVSLPPPTRTSRTFLDIPGRFPEVPSNLVMLVPLLVYLLRHSALLRYARSRNKFLFEKSKSGTVHGMFK